MAGSLIRLNNFEQLPRPRGVRSMKNQRLVLSLVLIVTAVLGPAALRQSAQAAPPVYTVHTPDDTVWVRMDGVVRPSYIASKMENPYNGNVTFADSADTLVLFAGSDTVVIPPTSGTVGLRIIGPHTTVEGILNCSITADMVLKLATDKLALLRHYGEFGTILPAEGVQFSYSKQTASDLVALRTKYHLDSIAGNGDEFSRQWNLCRWLHHRIRHDGSSANPKPANAEHIIEVCDAEGRGVNCRMMATALNEFYLAMGYKSRHLTCLPYDTTDQDCHVIDMVWSDQYDKWLYMDPTFEAYWTDKFGTPLSPWEVRKAMLNGDSLLVSDSINWNSQYYSRLEYFNYMAKNLFRFSCPIESAYGYEARDTIGHIELDPSSYSPLLLGVAEHNASGTRSDYYTDDPTWFFAPPK